MHSMICVFVYFRPVQQSKGSEFLSSGPTMSSSDEDDYMSDKFSVEKVSDVRPGLVTSRKRQREILMSSKKQKTERDVQHARRPEPMDALREGLARSIPRSNIGFALLTKMGYKEGSSLGKSGQEGLKEPLGIAIKVDRKGLGREEALRTMREKQHKMQAEKKLRQNDGPSLQDPLEFRRRMVLLNSIKQNEGDFQRCQRVCQSLDEEMQYAEPAMPWFWPEKPQVGEEEDDDAVSPTPPEDEVQYEVHEKLEFVNDYLRTVHAYCNWCGVKFDSPEDMATNCPGTTRDDH